MENSRLLRLRVPQCDDAGAKGREFAIDLLAISYSESQLFVVNRNRTYCCPRTRTSCAEQSICRNANPELACFPAPCARRRVQKQ